jgi:hypothetical protein
MDRAAALDELFTSTLEAFVETRARLAAALIAAGHKEEGQALKKMRRPSPAAWATNQVVRRARGEVDAFLEASDRLRGSQADIVAGRGERGVYQADVEDLRRATAALTEAARRVLEERGRADDRPILERVVANARAAALTDAGRQALLAGELVADLDGGADAFGGLLGGALGAAGAAASPAPTPPRPPARSAPTPAPSARDVEAQRRAEARARELEEARSEESSARGALAASEAASEATRATLDEARARVEDAHAALREAERALRDAEAAHRAAQRDTSEAETRAGRATRRREGLEK